MRYHPLFMSKEQQLCCTVADGSESTGCEGPLKPTLETQLRSKVKMLLPLPQRYGNLVLSSLTAADHGILQPYLAPVRFKARQCLEQAFRKTDAVFFPSSGLMSVVAVSRNKHHETEVGIVGWEGMTGAGVVLGDEMSTANVFVQIEGEGASIDAGRLREAMVESCTLRQVLLRAMHAFLVQASHTALANSRGKLEQRLARWLLMANDRMGGESLHMTHEFLALMLGSRRAGVTQSLQALHETGLIFSSRGQIDIVDRPGLEDRCDGLYGTPERELQRLFSVAQIGK